MCNRAMLYDIAAIEGPSATVFGHVQKHGCYAQDCRVSYNHRATCARASHDVVPWSCDILRHRTRSHNNRTTVIVFRC